MKIFTIVYFIKNSDYIGEYFDEVYAENAEKAERSFLDFMGDGSRRVKTVKEGAAAMLYPKNMRALSGGFRWSKSKPITK